MNNAWLGFETMHDQVLIPVKSSEWLVWLNESTLVGGSLPKIYFSAAFWAISDFVSRFGSNQEKVSLKKKCLVVSHAVRF